MSILWFHKENGGRWHRVYQLLIGAARSPCVSLCLEIRPGDHRDRSVVTHITYEGFCVVSKVTLRGTTVFPISCADVQEGATEGSDKSHAVRRVRPDMKMSGPGLGGTPTRRMGIAKRISPCIACLFH